MAIHKRKLDFSDNVLTKKTERSAANSPNEINQYIFSRGIDYFLSESCSKLKKEIMIKPITQSFQKLRTPRKDEINIQNNKTSSKYGKKLKTYHKFSYDASTECRKNPTHNDQKQYNSAIDSKKRVGKVFEEYINATRPHNKSLLDCTNETSDAIKVCNSNLINHPGIDNYSYFSRKNQNTQNPVFSVFNKIISVPNSKSEPTPKNCILKEYFLEPLNFNHKHSKEVRENFKLPPLSEQLDGKCQSEPTKNTSKKFSIFEKFPETFADVSEIDSRKIKKIASKSSKRNKRC
ncbi:hypothetical protein HHI36_005018 [Cryptolaemus montrouzieri]|uniref:Uncharacterized protein n=1 Tax=Cryptolaemus montrouzieri TaxID=559131 RepID=A0ABD2NSY6_9CUCU